jgi:putative SOS response-associated peptidase YedK
MCGRITITTQKVEAILKRFKAEPAPGFSGYVPRFNAAPSQLIPAIVAKEGGKRFLTAVYWGLTPPWAEKEGSQYSTQINIRDDTIDRNAFFKKRLLENRCVFVADGFYEWQAPKGSGGKSSARADKKIPHRIVIGEEELFPLAGLWRTLQEGEMDPPVLTGAIITTAPNTLMATIHNRMPVILDDDALDLWLDPSCKEFGKLRPFLAPFPDGKMKAYPVTTTVNNPRNDTPDCVLEAT